MALHRTVVESELFSERLAALSRGGTLKRLDDALSGVVFSIASKPEAYDCVVKDVRLVKTAPLGGMPALSIRFKIVDTNTVELLHVETTNPADHWGF